MDRSNLKYECTPSCPYRRETPGMCNAGAIQIPIEDGRQCLYPTEVRMRNLEIAQTVDFREIAAHKWD
jgi:hypothetical protein